MAGKDFLGLPIRPPRSRAAPPVPDRKPAVPRDTPLEPSDVQVQVSRLVSWGGGSPAGHPSENALLVGRNPAAFLAPGLLAEGSGVAVPRLCLGYSHGRLWSRRERLIGEPQSLPRGKSFPA